MSLINDPHTVLHILPLLVGTGYNPKTYAANIACLHTFLLYLWINNISNKTHKPCTVGYLAAYSFSFNGCDLANFYYSKCGKNSEQQQLKS